MQCDKCGKSIDEVDHKVRFLNLCDSCDAGLEAQGGKTWTKEEVLALQKNNPQEYAKLREGILQAMSEGKIK